jgi:hypothetical protein
MGGREARDLSAAPRRRACAAWRGRARSPAGASWPTNVTSSVPERPQPPSCAARSLAGASLGCPDRPAPYALDASCSAPVSARLLRARRVPTVPTIRRGVTSTCWPPSRTLRASPSPRSSARPSPRPRRCSRRGRGHSRPPAFPSGSSPSAPQHEPAGAAPQGGEAALGGRGHLPDPFRGWSRAGRTGPWSTGGGPAPDRSAGRSPSCPASGQRDSDVVRAPVVAQRHRAALGGGARRDAACAGLLPLR